MAMRERERGSAEEGRQGRWGGGERIEYDHFCQRQRKVNSEEGKEDERMGDGRNEEEDLLLVRCWLLFGSLNSPSRLWRWKRGKEESWKQEGWTFGFSEDSYFNLSLMFKHCFTRTELLPDSSREFALLITFSALILFLQTSNFFHSFPWNFV